VYTFDVEMLGWALICLARYGGVTENLYEVDTYPKAAFLLFVLSGDPLQVTLCVE
jgi:hypothetical protein